MPTTSSHRTETVSPGSAQGRAMEGHRNGILEPVSFQEGMPGSSEPFTAPACCKIFKKAGGHHHCFLITASLISHPLQASFPSHSTPEHLVFFPTVMKKSNRHSLKWTMRLREHLTTPQTIDATTYHRMFFVVLLPHRSRSEFSLVMESLVHCCSVPRRFSYRIRKRLSQRNQKKFNFLLRFQWNDWLSFQRSSNTAWIRRFDI